MRIDTNSHHQAPGSRTNEPAATAAPGFEALVTEGGTAGNEPRPDFTCMTRRELFDWMNGQIRSGAMTLDESSPFLGMTVHIAAGSGTAGLDDTVRVDFTDKARQGIDFLRTRADTSAAERLQRALDLMESGVA